MKLLENYIKAVEELEEYFGIDNLNNYSIEIKDSFFTTLDNGAIAWAETEGNLKNRNSGEFYATFYGILIEKEELTLILVDNDIGGDNYWIIFETKNKRDY
ncbi:MAG: hypothetical protein ACRCX2_21200 [Paraclostridium sp.]